MGRPCLDFSSFSSETMQVIGKHGTTNGGKIRWGCLCHCGNKYVATSSHLKEGRAQHCGCLTGKRNSDARKTHKMTGTKEFRAWSGIKNRCYNKNDKQYFRYGGRGIKVCDEWLNSFDAFFNDMGFATSDKHSLDRIDVNGDYSKSNCRWATAKEQAANRRNNVYIDYQIRSLLWDRFKNTPVYQRALYRINKKQMGIADAVFQPAWAVR